jgi:TatA/E family protein of Tat protein translocase
MFLRDLLQPTHLIVLLAVYLIFFGSGKLPEFGKQLGSGLKGLKESFNDAKDKGEAEKE